MEIRKIFKAGNSHVLSLPNAVMEQLGLKEGSQIAVELDKENRRLVISPISISESPAIKGDYVEMLEEFITEYKTALDELAK